MELVTKIFVLIFNVFLYVGKLTASVVFPGIPPNHIKFESYALSPALRLEGNLAPNKILNNARVLEVDEEIIGSESVSIRGDELYMGDKKGRIVKVKNGKVSTVANFGFPCDVVGKNTCSWPLGTRFDPNGKLIFTDSYGGLIRLNVDTGEYEQLVSRGQHIDGAPIGFPEDLDISKDGTIYWTDGSSTSTAETIYDAVFGQASGRLLKYDPLTNQNTVLLDNLHLANGVQLSEDEDFILVSETLLYRVRRYFLKGDRKGQSDIFIDGLPGSPDNIRQSVNSGGFYVSLFAPRPKIEIGRYPSLRKFIAGIAHLLEQSTSGLYRKFPHRITLEIYYLAHSLLEPREEEPKNGFIVELNEHGEIVGSLQSTNVNVHGISQITVGDKYTYLGAAFNKKIWVVDTKDLPVKNNNSL